MGLSESETQSAVADPDELPSLKDWGDGRWRKDAACKGADINWFFPKKYKEDKLASVSDGRLICASCSVRKECLDFALRNNIVHGTFGGSTVRDRRALTNSPKDGSMVFSTVVSDFRRVHEVEISQLLKETALKELSRYTNIPVRDLRKMITSGKEYLLPPDGSPPQETHLYGKSLGTSDQI